MLQLDSKYIIIYTVTSVLIDIGVLKVVRCVLDIVRYVNYIFSFVI